MTNLTRRAAVAAIGGFPAILKAQTRRPNLLLVVTDDQRWDGMSCAGNKILNTPHMDRLAAGGVRFTEAFVTNALCSPSRACMLSGMYSNANGVTANGEKATALTGGRHTFRDGVETYPMLLQRAGYYGAAIGKWHIATEPRGFDHYSILPGQGLYHNPAFITNGTRTQHQGYVDDVIADQAIASLRGRPKDKPFQMWVGFKAPHRAWQPPERHAKLYDDIEIPEPPTFNTGLTERPRAIRDTDMQIADMPDFRQRGVPAELPREERKKRNYQVFMKNYYRVLKAADENLGRLLDYLDEEKLAENTLVVFTGDNGFFLGEYGMFDKRLMYDPSIRVPMLVRYPAAVRPRQVNREHAVINNDIAHTFLDYAGVAAPAAARGHGASWRPVLEGKRTSWRESWFYNYFEYPASHCAGMMRGVRTRRHKLIHYIQSPEAYEFFDLEKDPQETRNRAEDPAYKSVVADLKRQLEQYRAQYGDDRNNDGKEMLECTNRMRPL